MRLDDPNLPLLTRVAEALRDLREELVFVGGCAAGLLLDDPAAGEIRATQDVDAIVEAATLADLYRVEARLAERGFVRDQASGVPNAHMNLSFPRRRESSSLASSGGAGVRTGSPPARG